MESKIEATHRLEREGRWEDACRFREAARKESREKGLKRREANDRAWELMIAEFPPKNFLEDKERKKEPYGSDALEQLAVGSTDFQADLDWAYSNICNAEASASDAPCGPAWFLLDYARSHPSDFLKKYMDFEHKKRKEIDHKQATEIDRKKQMGYIELLVDELEVAMKNEREADLLRWVQESAGEHPDEVATALIAVGWNVTLPG
jgi:hypothetical protein